MSATFVSSRDVRFIPRRPFHLATSPAVTPCCATWLHNHVRHRTLLPFSTMSLSVKSVSTITKQYECEIHDLLHERARDPNPFLEKLTLQRMRLDMPRLLNALSTHKADRAYQATRSLVLSLSNQIEDLLYDNQGSIQLFARRHQEAPEQVPEPLDPACDPSQQTVENDDDYASLRKRLLADGDATSFDADKKELMNDYHESFQEDIISDLTALASTLKTSAQTLSTKIVDDSKLVSESGETMMKSLSLMQSVGLNLNSYLSEKSGGKISIFFMIKTMAFVFILFFCMIVVTKILPKM